MSSGDFFIQGRYTATEGGGIYKIRVQPETVTAWNPNTTAAVNAVGSVRVGGGNRQLGIKARSVTLQWADAPPNNYKDAYIRVPVLTATAFNGLALGQTVQYLGADAVIVGKNPERVK